MIATVYEVKPGARFTVYEKEYIKIDREAGEGWHLSLGRDKKVHGYALELEGGVIAEFPVGARCEVQSADHLLTHSAIAAARREHEEHMAKAAAAAEDDYAP